MTNASLTILNASGSVVKFTRTTGCMMLRTERGVADREVTGRDALSESRGCEILNWNMASPG